METGQACLQPHCATANAGGDAGGSDKIDTSVVRNRIEGAVVPIFRNDRSASISKFEHMAYSNLDLFSNANHNRKFEKQEK